MPKFDVYLTRHAVVEAFLTVDAPDEEAAAAAALALADTAKWEIDECAATPPPEVSGVDRLEGR